MYIKGSFQKNLFFNNFKMNIIAGHTLVWYRDEVVL